MKVGSGEIPSGIPAVGWARWWAIFRMIRFSHTVFALPFAYLGAILGNQGNFPSWSVLGWITLAMIGARSLSMTVNRLADLKWDAANPRTRDRELPTGLITVGFARFFSAIMLILFILATFALPSLAASLCPLAVLFLLGYAYTKRFTWWCHFFLGATLGMAPAGGWIAVTGVWSETAVGLMILVTLWVAGFDILYACADAEFDRKARLHAIPARFGVPRAIMIAGILHVLMAIGWLALAYWSGFLRPMFLVGWIVSLMLLMLVHYWVRHRPIAAWSRVVFSCNGGVGVVLFLGVMLDQQLGVS